VRVIVCGAIQPDLTTYDLSEPGNARLGETVDKRAGLALGDEDRAEANRPTFRGSAVTHSRPRRRPVGSRRSTRHSRDEGRVPAIAGHRRLRPVGTPDERTQETLLDPARSHLRNAGRFRNHFESVTAWESQDF
jgi:hypothetical protein